MIAITPSPPRIGPFALHSSGTMLQDFEQAADRILAGADIFASQTGQLPTTSMPTTASGTTIPVTIEVEAAATTPETPETQASPASPTSLTNQADTSIIAHSPSTGTAVSTSSSQPAQFSTRRAACTHINLTRIYGHYRCHHCGRVPRIGWVYRCTQDLGDDLVGFRHQSDDNFTSALRRRLQHESDERSQLAQISEDPMASIQTTTDLQTSDADNGDADKQSTSSDQLLKPWMKLAKHADVYSREQCEVLKSQRRRVLDCIAASAYPEPPSRTELQDMLIADPISMLPGPGSSHYNRRYRRQVPSNSQALPSTTISPYWWTPRSSGSLNRRQNHQPSRSRQSGVFGAHGSYTPSDQQLQQSELQQPSVCVYQTCSTCRPITRDRTWQCLDPSHFVTASTNTQLPDLSIDNRPISHPHLVQNVYDKFMNRAPAPDIMTNSMYTAADISEYDDDDDFDLTTSGYDSSEISPDNSSDGTPTMSYYDDPRSWGLSSRWMAPAPTPPHAPLPFGQPMPAPSVAYGNPLSGYGPGYSGQRRILRRASSMDPRMLRSAREMAEMADIGLVGLGLAIAPTTSEANKVSPEDSQISGEQIGPNIKPDQQSKDKSTGKGKGKSKNGSKAGRQERMSIKREDSQAGASTRGSSLGGSYSRSGAVSAVDLRPSLEEQLTCSSSSFPAPGQLNNDTGSEVFVHGGVAVTEEALESGEPDVMLSAEEEEHLRQVEELAASDEKVALFG